MSWRLARRHDIVATEQLQQVQVQATIWSVVGDPERPSLGVWVVLAHNPSLAVDNRRVGVQLASEDVGPNELPATSILAAKQHLDDHPDTGLF